MIVLYILWFYALFFVLMYPFLKISSIYSEIEEEMYFNSLIEMIEK